MTTCREGLEALRTALREHGGTVGSLVGDHDSADASLELAGPAQLASSGPRVDANPAEYELLLEMILEGSRLHYGGPRAVATDDPDLALLLGDQLYALGLSRLAALGDLEAVAALADAISQLAQAHAEGRPGRSEGLWETAAQTIGWGPGS
jgi:hypothetical protein